MSDNDDTIKHWLIMIQLKTLFSCIKLFTRLWNIHTFEERPWSNLSSVNLTLKMKSAAKHLM